VFRRLAQLAGLLALLGWSCGGGTRDLEQYRDSPGDPKRLAPRERSELERARRALDSSDFAVGRTILEELAASRPDDVELAVLAQEAAFVSATPELRARMIESARRAAAVEPTALSLLLAARVEPNAETAREFARLALQAAPANPWTHYAVAFLDARAAHWTRAAEGVAKALELDPGHRPARRLEAAILARSGDPEEAIEALELWIEAVENDPRVDPADRTFAQLDVARLYMLQGDEEQALEVMRSVPETPSQRVRRSCLEAAIEQGLGHVERALAASRAAQKADPNDVTPLLQEALLQQYHLKDSKAAREAWERVLASARKNVGLGALIDGLRARVTLERFEASAP